MREVLYLFNQRVKFVGPEHVSYHDIDFVTGKLKSAIRVTEQSLDALEHASGLLRYEREHSDLQTLISKLKNRYHIMVNTYVYLNVERRSLPRWNTKKRKRIHKTLVDNIMELYPLFGIPRRDNNGRSEVTNVFASY